MVQHHDAVAGTARQVVTDDYAMRLARGNVEADAAMQRHLAQTLTHPSTPLIAFASCPLANYSVCAPSQAGNGTVVVLLYNPLARSRTELHSAPVASSGVQVLDGAGRPVQSQVVQLPLTQVRTPQSAPFEVRWLATVQGLGVETFFLVHTSEARDSPSSPAVTSPPPRSPSSAAPARRSATSSAPVASAPSALQLANGCWQLTLDEATGAVLSAVDLQQNRSVDFSLAFLYYKAERSSHYSFGPAGEAALVSNSSSVLGSALLGNVSREVQVRVSDWVSYTLRLSMAPCDQGGADIIVDYVVGPVPTDDGVGKEVIVRYSVPSIASGAVFATDSNGREWQPRVRDQRPTWNLTVTDPIGPPHPTPLHYPAPRHHPTHSPSSSSLPLSLLPRSSAGNYYPVVSGLYLNDPASLQSLLVLNDRANGGSSLRSGEVELMLHRRLVGGLLAGEPLSETENGVGLIVRGSHSLLLGSAQAVARRGRQVQSRLYSPLAASYAALPSSSGWSQYAATHNTSVSFLRTQLPVELELASLYLRLDGSATLRLAHSYGVTETAAAPYNAAGGVTVDLSTLFTAAITSVVERTLTDNADRATMEANRLQWKSADARQSSRHVSDRRRGGLHADGMNATILPMEVRTFRVTFA